MLTTPGTYTLLNGNLTLDQVNEKYWQLNRPLEMFYTVQKKTTGSPNKDKSH